MVVALLVGYWTVVDMKLAFGGFGGYVLALPAVETWNYDGLLRSVIGPRKRQRYWCLLWSADSDESSPPLGAVRISRHRADLIGSSTAFASFGSIEVKRPIVLSNESTTIWARRVEQAQPARRSSETNPIAVTPADETGAPTVEGAPP